MIEAKGLRRKSGLAEAVESLELEPEEKGHGRRIAALMTGLGALALYLKSFLWSPAEAMPAFQSSRKRPPDDEPPEADDLPDVLETPAEPLEEPDPESGMPLITGPFDAWSFLPEELSRELPRPFANSPLPPFRFVLPSEPQVQLAEVSLAEVFAASPVLEPLADDRPSFQLPKEREEQDEDDPENPNRAPRNSGPVHLGDIGSGGALAIMLADLLQKTEDPDGDALTIKFTGIDGGTIRATDSNWQFLADTETLGEIEITYVIRDGHHQIEQTAIVNIVENEFAGTDDDDMIVATDGRDFVYAGAGNDIIVAGGGRDTALGEAGDDTIAGGSGDDVLHGGAGDDLIAGGEGNDWISGGVGNDRLYGQAGDDVLYGGEGDDRIEGGEGDDLLFGGGGDDLLKGENGNDILDGGSGEDILLGGGGDDILKDGEGADTVEGNDGDDLVLAVDDGDNDIYDGGAGVDTLDYSAATEAVEIDMTKGIAVGDSIGTDRYENFENFTGSRHDDTFVAGSTDATLSGNGGADLYQFLAGDMVGPDIRHFRITDFDDHDRLDFGKDGYTWRAVRSLEDRIEDFFEELTEELGADEPRLQFSHDWSGDYRRTLIEVDFDRDRITDLEIELNGDFQFLVEQV